ncbi:sensor histidine kinase [Enterococcus sp. LJL98]
MFYVIDTLNIIDPFLAFVVFDRLSLKSRKNSLGATLLLLLVIYLQIKLIIPVVSELFFVVFLVSLSYMNRRDQSIGITLFHFVLAFGLFKLNNFLFYPRDILLFLALEATAWQVMFYVGVTVTLSVCLSLLFRKYVLSKMQLHLKQWLGHFLFLGILSLQAILLYHYLLKIPTGMEKGVLVELAISLLMLLIGIFSLSIFIFSSNQKLAFEIKEKKTEQQMMKLYMEEMNKKNQVIRQFKHDYLNILTTLEGHLETGEVTALKNYYEQEIQPTRQLLHTDNTRLMDLHKIEQAGLRSLLTAKILLAQEKGIPVHLEIEEINWRMKVNEITFIRIVGILLDNAIEELEELGQGRLEVALFLKQKEIHLLIRNTARTMIEPFYQLKESGFSTKGEGRGLGLSTVETLVNQSTEFFLETTIDQNYFIQNLTIIGENAC